MQISENGLALVKHFEGLYLKAYKCPSGVWTIGYGHTGLAHKDGTVKAGRVITKKEADALLRHDMRSFEQRVEELAGASQKAWLVCQFDALVSFDFNTGALHRSTLLRKLNESRPDAEVAAEFLRWTRANGKVLAGLVRRRKAERALFLGANWREFAP
jgi:lysozyme